MKNTYSRYKNALTWLSLLIGITACAQMAQSEETDLNHKFRGIGGAVIVLSSASRQNCVTITTETGRQIAAPSLLARGGGGRLDFSSTDLPVPKTVHVVWKDKSCKAIWGKGGIDYEGTIIGDYTVPVAEHIPNALLDDIRQSPRGNLRIKIRLKDDGVLIGWDIEREGKGKYTFDYEMAGGDFREARIYNGKVERKGWYINKNGQKIETDY